MATPFSIAVVEAIEILEVGISAIDQTDPFSSRDIKNVFKSLYYLKSLSTNRDVDGKKIEPLVDLRRQATLKAEVIDARLILRGVDEE